MPWDYIRVYIKIDRGEEYWVSPFTYDGEVNINYYYPNADDITSQQKTYIEDYVTEFKTALDGRVVVYISCCIKFGV